MAKGIRRNRETQEIVKHMAKAGATTKQITETLKNKFGQAYRKQDIQTDMANYLKREKKTKAVEPLEKRLTEYKKEKKTSDTPLSKKQSKYTPKKYKRPEVTGYRYGSKGNWQKKKYSVVVEFIYKKEGKRKLEETYRTLSYNNLPPNEAIIYKDAVEMWTEELIQNMYDMYKGELGELREVHIESITELIV